MIKIRIPNNNIKERKYVLDIIFNEFLGLNYSLDVGSEDYVIVLENKKKITIQDTFFNKFPQNLEYLHLRNIPKSINELDMFSTCFFMLTRWEEYVNKNRDKHNRFPATQSLAYQEGFLNRPIVNEKIEELKEKLLAVDGSLIFKKKEFELVITHDVDEVNFWKSKKQLLKILVGDMLKRKDINLAFNRIKEYYLVSQGKIKDPFDTFDWFIDRSKELEITSRFYFMSGGVTKYDNRYDISTQKSLIEKIKNTGNIIGIHPSYNAYNDSQQFKKEKELLEKVCGCKITEGREHYLRFEVPTTWQIWEDNDMKVDSTCGYAEKEGFRCGTGDEFSVFNILTQEKLNLKERPLIYMDDTSFFYQELSEEEVLINISNLHISYSMTYTILWHQNFGKKNLYLKIIKKLKEEIE